VKSIESKGVLEPLLVRPLPDGRFRIIAGERRFRAALEAGLAEVPCIELEVADSEVLEIALIENLHRKDLHPFEEAEGLAGLTERHGYTQQQVADAIGKSGFRSQRRCLSSTFRTISVGNVGEPTSRRSRSCSRSHG